MALIKFHVTTTEGIDEEAQVIFADQIKADVLRNRLNLPSGEGNESISVGLLIFSSLLRNKKIAADTKVDDFLGTIENVDPVSEEPTEGAEFPESATTQSDN